MFVCLPNDVVSLHAANVPKPPETYVVNSGVKVSSLIFILCNLSAMVITVITRRQGISKTSRDCVYCDRSVNNYNEVGYSGTSLIRTPIIRKFRVRKKMRVSDDGTYSPTSITDLADRNNGITGWGGGR